MVSVVLIVVVVSYFIVNILSGDELPPLHHGHDRRLLSCEAVHEPARPPHRQVSLVPVFVSVHQPA